MPFEGIFLEADQFNRLCPFFVLVDKTLKIESYGKSIEKLAPGFKNKPYDSLFQFKRPFVEANDRENILSLVNQLIVIELVDRRIPLRGQLEVIDGTEKLLFIGSPWFGSMEQVKDSGLNLHDFAYHDPLIDLLHVLKTQEITNSELKELLVTVNRQKNDLKLAREEAVKLANAKEAFLANMSHEIRTPLNGVIGMVRELTKTDLSSKQELCVTNAGTASQHLLSIINNILDLSKIEAGSFDLENKPFSLRQLLGEVERIMRTSAEDKGVDLSFNISSEISDNLLGDSSRIRQVLINILSNSIKFTESGSVRLYCRPLDSNSVTQNICITISDTGIGMDDAFLKTIFKKFTQENESIKRKYGGTGLGMAITYELIQLMKGQIKVASTKGLGSQFEITMAFEIDKEWRGNEKEISDYEKSLSGKRILLVEDNELNRLVVTNLLGHYNVNTVEATNGQEALEKVGSEFFDLILMDLQMPVMDGLQAARNIRKLKITTPIVALTANAFKSEVDKCKVAGMNDFASKPFDEAILLNTIVKNLWNTPQFPLDKKITPEKGEQKLYDLSRIFELSHGNKSFVKRIIDIFCQQASMAIDGLTSAVEMSDIKSMNKIAHKIKPSLIEMGIKSLKEEIIYLESVTGSSPRDKISKEANKVIDVLRSVTNQLKSY
ncbi:MAG: response regulator [Cyclobacteriaceae bacterium]